MKRRIKSRKFKSKFNKKQDKKKDSLIVCEYGVKFACEMAELSDEKLDDLDPSLQINRNKLLNDANFAVISAFLEKFSEPCGIEPRVDTEELINWLINTDEGN